MTAGVAHLRLEPIRVAAVDPGSVFDTMEQARRNGSLAGSVTTAQDRYQASVSHPGFLERISSDGIRSVGTFVDGVFRPCVERLGVVSIRGKRDIRSQRPAHLGAAAGELNAQPGSSRIRWPSAVSLSSGWPQPGRRRPKTIRGLLAWSVVLNAQDQKREATLELMSSYAPVFCILMLDIPRFSQCTRPLDCT